VGYEGERERPLSDVLVDQVEFCDVLLLNKCDLVPEVELDRIEGVIRRLQPRAEVVRTTHCDVDADRVLDTGRFDLEAAQREVGWKRELAGDDHDHAHGAAERVGVDSFVYRADRPFHPEQLDRALEDLDGGVIRAKGVFWLAGRDDVMGLNQAGESVRAGPIGEWRPDDERRTELVFIGTDMDEAGIRETLDDCLLGGDATERFDDPFP
jgi:G3E family GTPase